MIMKRIKHPEETKGGVVEGEVIMDAAETILVAVTILTGPAMYMISHVLGVVIGFAAHSADLVNEMRLYLHTESIFGK